MTDKEKRAHDLAVSYVQYGQILQYFEDDSLKMIASDLDYLTEYEAAYSSFLEKMNG